MIRNYDLLIVDDDRELNQLLVEYLSQFGHRLRTATSAEAGKREIRMRCPDLMILDVMLPDQNGLSLCREIRLEWDFPIIMLTARGDVADRILGLELGADDYVPKPFEPRELVARIESVIRRGTREGSRGVLSAGELVLEPESRRVFSAGRRIDLTSTEFELLKLFMESRGRVLTRDQALNRLRGFDSEVYDRSVDMLVSRLRKKLGDDSRSPRFIKTIWGTGYQFVGQEDPGAEKTDL